MIDFLLWTVAGLWGLALAQLILNRLAAPPIENTGAPAPETWPFISIVVPARNEEQGIREAVTSFCTQDYPRFEVIVVDDGSSDATPRILKELQSRFKHLRVIRGAEPPPGWLGKPNTLERGRKEASGEWLVFSDADIVYTPAVLKNAAAFALHERAGMLFLMPHLQVGGVLEAAVMSMLHMGFALLPLFLITRTRIKIFAGGSGVFNMVRRDALEACGAFACLKDAVIDDIGLGFKVKAAGFKQAFAFAQDSIRLRMYPGAWAAIEGFTKNSYPGLSAVPGLIPLLFISGFIVSFLPYLGLAAAALNGTSLLPAAAALTLMHAAFGAVTLIFRLPWPLAFLNPVRELLWWGIVTRSFLAYRRSGGVRWRGRTFRQKSTRGAEIK